MEKSKLIHKLITYQQAFNELDLGKTTERTRYLGAIESLLILLGGIDGGKPLPFQEVEYTSVRVFFKNEVLTRKETYKEMLFRITKDVIDEWFKNLK